MQFSFFFYFSLSRYLYIVIVKFIQQPSIKNNSILLLQYYSTTWLTWILGPVKSAGQGEEDYRGSDVAAGVSGQQQEQAGQAEAHTVKQLPGHVPTQPIVI